MKTCKECQRKFKPKRKEQILCSMVCRQKVNAKKRKGKKIGLRKKWNYSSTINRDGYEMIYAGNHLYADGRKMIAKHVAIIELAIKRRLKPEECVHHKDGNKRNNEIKNLQIMLHADHSRKHNREIAKTRKREAGRFA